MPSDLAPKNRRAHGPSISWSPLLMLGGSVVASVVLISTCMAMIGPDAQAPAPATIAAPR